MAISIVSLIDMCKAQIAYLGQLRVSAERLGDVEQITAIDVKLTELETTLNKLLTLT